VADRVHDLKSEGATMSLSASESAQGHGSAPTQEVDLGAADSMGNAADEAGEANRFGAASVLNVG
jgi:hypothetical protein